MSSFINKVVAGRKGLQGAACRHGWHQWAWSLDQKCTREKETRKELDQGRRRTAGCQAALPSQLPCPALPCSLWEGKGREGKGWYFTWLITYNSHSHIHSPIALARLTELTLCWWWRLWVGSRVSAEQAGGEAPRVWAPWASQPTPHGRPHMLHAPCPLPKPPVCLHVQPK